MKEIQYEIVKEIAVLSKGDSGYTKEKQLEMLTGSGMKEMDYREEITSLEHACSKLVVSLMNIVQQMERSVTEIFEL